jgi:hypothetical protein
MRSGLDASSEVRASRDIEAAWMFRRLSPGDALDAEVAMGEVLALAAAPTGFSYACIRCARVVAVVLLESVAELTESP